MDVRGLIASYAAVCVPESSTTETGKAKWPSAYKGMGLVSHGTGFTRLRGRVTHGTQKIAKHF